MLTRGRNTQHTPVRTVGDEPQRAVGALPHVADTFAETLQQPFLVTDLVAIDIETHQEAWHQGADEQATLPFREQLARVERHAGGRDRRHPVFNRLLHAGLLRARVNFGAAVVDAVTDHRPAVILAFVDDVDLVAAARTVLMLP